MPVIGKRANGVYVGRELAVVVAETQRVMAVVAEPTMVVVDPSPLARAERTVHVVQRYAQVCFQRVVAARGISRVMDVGVRDVVVIVAVAIAVGPAGRARMLVRRVCRWDNKQRENHNGEEHAQASGWPASPTSVGHGEQSPWTPLRCQPFF